VRGMPPPGHPQPNKAPRAPVGVIRNETPLPMEWIPAKERLPEQGSPVLLTLADDKGARVVEPGYIDAAQVLHTFTRADAAATVVAWMPLPDPYLG